MLRTVVLCNPPLSRSRIFSFHGRHQPKPCLIAHAATSKGRNVSHQPSPQCHAWADNRDLSYAPSGPLEIIASSALAGSWHVSHRLQWWLLLSATSPSPAINHTLALPDMVKIWPFPPHSHIVFRSTKAPARPLGLGLSISFPSLFGSVRPTSRTIVLFTR